MGIGQSSIVRQCLKRRLLKLYYNPRMNQAAPRPHHAGRACSEISLDALHCPKACSVRTPSLKKPLAKRLLFGSSLVIVSVMNSIVSITIILTSVVIMCTWLDSFGWFRLLLGSSDVGGLRGPSVVSDLRGTKGVPRKGV